MVHEAVMPHQEDKIGFTSLIHIIALCNTLLFNKNCAGLRKLCRIDIVFIFLSQRRQSAQVLKNY